MSRTYRIREADGSDAPAISRLLRRVSLRYIAPGQPQPAVQAMLRHMGVRAVRQRLTAPNYRFHVAVAGPALLGVVAVRDDAHLHHLFVSTPYQRRGVARALWRKALEACMEGTGPARITVNASRYAEPAYRRLGFVDDPRPRRVPPGIEVVPMVYLCGKDGKSA